MSGWPVAKPIKPGDGDARHGSVNGYVNHECRCLRCKAAWAAEVERQRLARAARPIPPEKHGKASTYGNYGCRCQPCRDAHAADRRLYRRRKAAS